ncbi:PIN-like domain-containing protein [Lysobacter arvi]|uniref:PIN-like domain-containing protein n=1 Tax=Lysobacter arvi TaxID=3038776 RepID=A0ABU1CED4_9GAMM|nr:PIN-like domain-containing protein [Lysobacter arvi]MDR0183227.1 PIN-like domain-containing protein [Lysobacter arvi]
MRAIFPGFYQPDRSELASLWSEATIVLDTNVLLSLYEVSSSTRASVIDLLTKLKTRLWIPHHVALEFQRGRLGVISKQRQLLEDALAGTGKSIATIRHQVEANKRAADLVPVSILQRLSAANDDLTKVLEEALDAQLRASHIDPIRAAIDALFDGRVGSAPESKEWLEQVYADGALRYAAKRPPGFGDVAKEGAYVADGFSYQAKYGDWLAWKQTMDFAKLESVSSLIFVTSDVKEDWWTRSKKEIVGPHPELGSEIRKEANVERFWMYTLSDFLTEAPKHIQVEVAKEAVDDVRDFEVKLSSHVKDLQDAHASFGVFNSVHDQLRKLVVDSVCDWLLRSGCVARTSEGTADIVAAASNGDAVGVLVVDGRSSSPLPANFGLLVRLAKSASQYACIQTVIVVPNSEAMLFRANNQALLDTFKAAMDAVDGHGAELLAIGSLEASGSFDSSIAVAANTKYLGMRTLSLS